MMPKSVELLVLLGVLIAKTSMAQDSALPSLEMLEFIGQWEDGDDVWVDPYLLDDRDITETEREQIPADGEPLK